MKSSLYNNLLKTFLLIITILVFNSCDKNPVATIENKNLTDWEGEIGKFNTAYNDSILFASTRHLGTNFAPSIYIMHKDGTGMRALTNKYYTFNAIYSPRRLKILFIADTSFGNSSRVLYSMDVNGNNKKIISQPGEDVWAVACSPDGSKIAYIVLNSSQPKIRVINTKDNSVKDIFGGSGPSSLRSISWSSDSQKLVFDGILPNSRIGIVNADGTGFSELFWSSLGCYMPSYSPDGTMLAFVSFTYINGGYYSNIFIYDVNGKTYKAITNIKGFSNSPTWTRDNKYIYFSSRDIGQSPDHIFKVDITSKEITQITDGSGIDYSPFLW